jgi:hypothetical protein
VAATKYSALVCASSVGMIKAGVTGGERLAKLNEPIRIEDAGDGAVGLAPLPAPLAAGTVGDPAMTKPLAGIIVVSIEQALAAPLCTCPPADAGARVIKVERPEGDFAPGYDSAVHGMAGAVTANSSTRLGSR